MFVTFPSESGHLSAINRSHVTYVLCAPVTLSVNRPEILGWRVQAWLIGEDGDSPTTARFMARDADAGDDATYTLEDCERNAHSLYYELTNLPAPDQESF